MEVRVEGLWEGSAAHSPLGVGQGGLRKGEWAQNTGAGPTRVLCVGRRDLRSISSYETPPRPQRPSGLTF